MSSSYCTTSHFRGRHVTTRRSPTLLPLSFVIVVVVVSVAALILMRDISSVAAAPVCAVELSLPAGSAAQLAPGASATFSYTVTVTAEEVREISVDVIAGSTSGLILSIQPASATISVTQPDIRQSYPLFGSITVTVPQDFGPGTYTITGLSSYVGCAVVTSDGTTMVRTRSAMREMSVSVSVSVIVPRPTATPVPLPTNTPVPAPVTCEAGFALLDDATLEALPGNRLTVPFEASVIVRRVSQVSLRVVSTYQGAMRVSVEPSQRTYSFELLSTDAVLRTFTGTITIDVPTSQPAGSYLIADLYARASCQSVDAVGSPTSFGSDSATESIVVRLWPPTPGPTRTPAPTPTRTPTPSPTATMTVTPTPSPVPSQTPTVTPTRTPSPTNTQAPSPTPRSIVRLPLTSVTETGEPAAMTAVVATPSSTEVEAESTGVVIPDEDGSAAMVFEWQANGAFIAEEPQTSGWLKPLAGFLSALLLGAGIAGAWGARGRMPR
jgi:hypothetical protein